MKTHIKDILISLLVIIICPLISLGLSVLLQASSAQKEWAMLYSVALVGAIAAFTCMLKIIRIEKAISTAAEKIYTE